MSKSLGHTACRLGTLVINLSSRTVLVEAPMLTRLSARVKST